MDPAFNNKGIIHIDGAHGEGGGQILRTSLALSVLSGKTVEIVNIRRARSKPGLQPQHLLSVKASAKICGGSVEGAALSSTTLIFRPGRIRSGEYRLDVSESRGSAGSTSLVLQTVLLPLLFAEHASTITLIGGTHVPWSPSFHYLKDVFLPVLSRLRAECSLELRRWGWYPGGGGEIVANVQPATELAPVTITERGALQSVRGISAVSNLPEEIATRQRNRAIKKLQEAGVDPEIGVITAPSSGKGTLLFLRADSDNIAAGFGSLGAIGKRAETVADEACAELREYLDSTRAVDPHLADQLMPYLALAKGASELTTSRVTEHLLTNIWVVKQFMDINIEVEGELGRPGKVSVKG